MLEVDVVLSDGGGDHGEGGQDEAGEDAFERGEGDAGFAEGGVDDPVHEWDEEDDG